MKQKRGFSMIETIITIAVFSLTIGAITTFLITAYRAQRYNWEQAIAIDEAKKGIETMVKEIREARSAEDGSYPIEKAEDKEFVFYSDIDADGKTERVRYFLGSVNNGALTQECVSFTKGGSCAVNLSNFLSGSLVSASVKASVEGDFGWSQEYADVFADGNNLGRLCQTGCSDCAGSFQGEKTFDVFSQSQDNSIQLMADSNSQVDPICSWQNPNHSMKARFELSWTENLTTGSGEFKKGVIKAVGDPPAYPSENEQISVLSRYVRNAPPIFEYFDKNGNKITAYPARLTDTKSMKVLLIIDVNPDQSPKEFQLESMVNLRNLKE